MIKINHLIPKQWQHIVYYIAICAVTIVYVTTFLCVEKRGFWIVDNANKFIQLQAINKSNFSDFSLPWLGRSIDPDYQYNPMPPPFSVVRNNKLYSVYPPLFATISVLFYRLFSFPGLYLLPLLFSIFGLMGLLKIANIINLGKISQSLAFIIAGLCTPLWFYSIVYWEHSIALCLCIWSILYCLRFLYTASYKYLILGSLISTCAIYFREELFLFCFTLLGALLIIQHQHKLKTTSIFLTTITVNIVPLLFFNWITIGYPLGFRTTSNLSIGSGIIEYITTRPLVFYHLFLKSSQNMFLSLIIATPLIILFLLHPRLRKRLFSLGFTLLSIFAFVISIYYLYSHLSSNAPINQIYYSNSLFVVAPVLALALMRYKDREEKKIILRMENWIWIIAVGYSFLFTFVTPFVTSWGIHWGNRILLLIYPLLAVSCAKNIENWYRLSNRRINWQTIICVLALLTSIGIQFYSINILHRKKTFSYHLNQEIQDYKGDVIVTNVGWAPQAIFSVFFSKMIFYESTKERYYQLTEKLFSKGHNEILFVTHARKGTQHLADKRIVDKKLDCFGLYFFMMDLSNNKE